MNSRLHGGSRRTGGYPRVLLLVPLAVVLAYGLAMAMVDRVPGATGGALEARPAPVALPTAA